MSPLPLLEASALLLVELSASNRASHNISCSKFIRALDFEPPVDAYCPHESKWDRLTERSELANSIPTRCRHRRTPQGSRCGRFCCSYR